MHKVIVIGAGHAGVESALACARMGINTLLIAMNLDAIALMACNPAIGGTAKGHLVREIDALGGEMGRAIDDTMIQSRMLNTSKGPAVRSLRAQADKRAYAARMKRAVFSQQNLTIREGECAEILTQNRMVKGVKLTSGAEILAPCVILACGVYLDSRIIRGDKTWAAGPQGLFSATHLSLSLRFLGFDLRRFKTGTPARVDGRSLDTSLMEPQYGDDIVTPFSFLTSEQLINKAACYLTYTTPETHAIIRENLHLAPMYAGIIKGTGARYCPSIEDKVVRFADKTRHPLFLEPEGLTDGEWYIQGMSTGLPEDVQVLLYRSIPGLHNANLTRLAYAIEYDTIDARALSPTLESRDVPGLFFAGQINGTSGYEEAAAQGLIAGINAARKIKGLDAYAPTRADAYIGVMLDDLTIKGVDEPYRMMTSRAEYRLLLRQDNADFRLTQIGHDLGLATDERLTKMLNRKTQTYDALLSLKERGQYDALKRPEVTYSDLDAPFLSPDIAAQVEIHVKYEGYIAKQTRELSDFHVFERWQMPEDIVYADISALRIEAREKLTKQRPTTLGQASRIPGVTPGDLSVLRVYIEKQRRLGEA